MFKGAITTKILYLYKTHMVVGFSEQRWGVLHGNNSWHPVHPSSGKVLGVSHEEQQP